MTDNLTTQSGTPATVLAGSVIATDDVSSVHFQKVKLDVGGDGVSVPASGDATYGLDVDVTRVQGTVAVTGTFYQATQPVSGTVAVTGAYQATQPVSLATAPTTPVTGTFWQTTQPVSGTVTANAGTDLNTSQLATFAKQPALGTAGTASVDVITVQGISGGTAQPVSLASVPSHAVTNAGTFAVQANTAPIASMVKGVSTATGILTTSLITAVATKQLAITSISVANTGTSASLITLQDGSGGTAMYVTMAPPGGGSNITLPTPILTTVGNGLFFVCGTASTTINISASGYSV